MEMEKSKKPYNFPLCGRAPSAVNHSVIQTRVPGSLPPVAINICEYNGLMND